MNARRIILATVCVMLALPPGSRASVADHRPPSEELIVLFSPSTTHLERRAVHRAAGAFVGGRIPELNIDHVRAPLGAAAAYEGTPSVLAVTEDRDLHLLKRPSDPLVKDQWGLKRVKAFDAWRIEKGRHADVTVAVVDTGIDSTHEDLEGRLVPGFDFVNLDEQPQDDEGHGTHVAGIIGATPGNRKGVAGLSWGAKIMGIKTCEAAGACPLYETYLGAVDAVRRGADIINMSLGGPGQCDFIGQTIFDWIRSQDVLTVVAAGNSAEDGNPSISPANCDNTLAVGAVDPSGKHAPFSSHGDFVDIAAPGVFIWSTYPPAKSIASGHIGYASLSGTSMAAPMVAGVAALVKARHPEWTPDEIEARLMKTARDAGPKGRDDKYGRGIVDAFRAVK